MSAPSLPEVPVFDEAVLRSITEAAGMEPLELLDLFLDDAAANLQIMKDAIATGNREAFNRAAHSLKSSAGNVGAARMVLFAQTLEKRTVSELAGDIAGVVKDLAAELREFDLHVQANRARLTG